MLQTRHEYNTSFFEQEDLNVINLKITEFSKITKLVYNIYRYNELTFSTEHKPISENVSIPFDELSLGDYRHELIMVFQGKKHIIFLGKLLIIEKNIEKLYCDENPNIVIDTENNIFNIEIKASGAQGIPGNNGWTPVYYDEVYEGKIIRKLADYISGSGTKPIGNIGLYISASGYTSDKKLALNYKGEKGEGTEIVISSVNPNQTSTQLNALADGLYFANGSGLYKFSPAVVMDKIDGVAVANNTVPEGYIITFSKKGNIWALNSAVKIPGGALPTMSITQKGGAKLGETLEIKDEVLNVIQSLGMKDSNIDERLFTKNGYYNTSGKFASTPSYISTEVFRCLEGMKFYIDGGSNQSETSVINMVTFYRKDLSYISGIKAKAEKTLVIAPLETYYVGFSKLNTTKDKTVYVDGKFWSLQNFDSEQKNLLVEYIRTENKVVTIHSIDFSTNTFYAPNHGLTGSTSQDYSVGFVFNNFDNSCKSDQLPIIPSQRINPFNVTKDTFQLRNLSSAEPIVLRNKLTTDITKFKIEEYGITSLFFTGFSKTISQLKIVIEGRFLGGVNSFRLNNLNSGIDLSNSGTLQDMTNAARLTNPQNSFAGFYEIEITKLKTHSLIKHNLRIVGSDGVNFITKMTDKQVILTEALDLTNLNLSGCAIANNSKISIYGS